MESVLNDVTFIELKTITRTVTQPQYSIMVAQGSERDPQVGSMDGGVESGDDAKCARSAHVYLVYIYIYIYI